MGPIAYHSFRFGQMGTLAYHSVSTVAGLDREFEKKLRLGRHCCCASTDSVLVLVGFGALHKNRVDKKRGCMRDIKYGDHAK